MFVNRCKVFIIALRYYFVTLIVICPCISLLATLCHSRWESLQCWRDETNKALYIMGKKTIQDILPLVEQPSRYLGSEINAIKKDRTKAKLNIVLAFPDLYEIGTSHFGLQILYHILNNQSEIVAERVFAPAIDMEAYLRSSDLPLTSLESQTPLNQFDIVGFSLLYELNYTNVLTILELSKIPFFSRQRDETHPLIIAGGPCTCNPEPMAEFFRCHSGGRRGRCDC